MATPLRTGTARRRFQRAVDEFPTGSGRGMTRVGPATSISRLRSRCARLVVHAAWAGRGLLRMWLSIRGRVCAGRGRDFA